MLGRRRFSLNEKTQNLTEVHEVAILLDKVKRAERIELTAGLSAVNELLNPMKSAKDNKSTVYLIVNSYNEQVDKAIIRLEGLSKDKNLQGLAGDNIKVQETISMSELTIAANDGANNTQGIEATGDVKLKGFSLTGATITVSSKQLARTEEEIKLEIARKQKSLERKNKMLDSHTEKGNDEAAQRVEKEIEKLEEEIDKLKSEQKQAQVEVNS